MLLNEFLAETHMEKGNVHMIHFEYHEAINEYNSAIALYPEHAGAFNNKGLALMKIGDINKAINSFDRALVLYRDSFNTPKARNYLKRAPNYYIVYCPQGVF